MIRAELLKLTTTRAPKIAAAVGILGVAATGLATHWLLPAISHLDPDMESSIAEMATSSADRQLAAMNVLGAGSLSSGSVSIGLVAVLLLGALIATADFRHGGIVATALAAPRRSRIMTAKTAATTAAMVMIGLGYALVQGLLVAVAPSTIGAGGLAATWWEVADVLGRGVLTLIPLGVLGLAAGMLIRSQSATFLVLIGAAVADVTAGALLSVVPATSAWSGYTPLALVATATGPAGGAEAVLALAILTMMALTAATAAWVTLRGRDL